MAPKVMKNLWPRFWMKFSGLNSLGRISCRLAGWLQPPYYGRLPLSRFGRNGYISPTAHISHAELSVTNGCFIGDGVTIYQDKDGGSVSLAEGVHLHRDTILQTGRGGVITIGADSHIQPRCQLSAYKGAIHIGKRGEIAPNCGFYPYDHSFMPNESIRRQPLKSRGGITIGDDVWLGFGVIVLDGVHIGSGAVVGAGSVVTKNIPEEGIAVGNPARIMCTRSSLERVE
jgi:acetyltransferase-like isoleucine patch superfamily enzyme